MIASPSAPVRHRATADGKRPVPDRLPAGSGATISRR